MMDYQSYLFWKGVGMAAAFAVMGVYGLFALARELGLRGAVKLTIVLTVRDR